MNLTIPLSTPVTSLVLIGGGEFSFGDTREIDTALLARMPAGRRRVAFIPTASGSAEYAVHFGAYLRTIDPEVEVVNVPVYRGRDVRRPRNLETVRSAGIVYLGGGVASQLLTELRESATEAVLRECAASGTVVAAIGAAAASFGAWTWDPRGAPIRGFGWLGDAVVLPAFDSENDAPLRRLMSQPDVHLGLGIPTKTALAIEPSGSASILGEGQVAAFRKRGVGP